MNTLVVKHNLMRHLLVQSIVALFAVLGCWLGSGRVVAYSFLLGSAVFILPTWLFSMMAFRHHGARAAKKIVASFYWGEALKIVLAIALFTLIFNTQTISVFAFFSGYLVNQFAMIVILARL